MLHNLLYMYVCVLRRKVYTFIFDGKCTTIFGTISADNPASCSLGGFKESTSAYRMCRQGMATHTDATEKVIS